MARKKEEEKKRERDMRKKRGKGRIEEGKWKERGETVERKRGIKRRY